MEINLADLRGEHTYDSKTRVGNYFSLRIFPWVGIILGGLTEAHYRGWLTLQLTIFLSILCGIFTIIGFVWIRSFNNTRYIFESGYIECVTIWPRRSWKVMIEEIETFRLDFNKGQWLLVLKLRLSGSKRVVLTKSMRHALYLK